MFILNDVLMLVAVNAISVLELVRMEQWITVLDQVNPQKSLQQSATAAVRAWLNVLTTQSRSDISPMVKSLPRYTHCLETSQKKKF